MLPALPTGRHVDVRRVAEGVHDLEGSRLLALDARRVDAVDQRDGVVLGELAGQLQAVVEVALDLQQPCAVRQRLRHLAERDLALRHQHGADHPGAHGVGGGGRAGVAGRRADDRVGALLSGLGDRERHAAVLEGAGRVGALDLEVHVAAGALGDGERRDQRRPTLAQRHDRRRVGDGQSVAVLLDDAAPGAVACIAVW